MWVKVTAWLRIPSMWGATRLAPAHMGSWIWLEMCMNGSPTGIRGIITNCHRLRIPQDLKMAPTESYRGEPGLPRITGCVNSYGSLPGSASNPISEPIPTLASAAPGCRKLGVSKVQPGSAPGSLWQWVYAGRIPSASHSHTQGSARSCSRHER